MMLVWIDQLLTALSSYNFTLLANDFYFKNVSIDKDRLFGPVLVNVGYHNIGYFSACLSYKFCISKLPLYLLFEVRCFVDLSDFPVVIIVFYVIRTLDLHFRYIRNRISEQIDGISLRMHRIVSFAFVRESTIFTIAAHALKPSPIHYFTYLSLILCLNRFLLYLLSSFGRRLRLWKNSFNFHWLS